MHCSKPVPVFLQLQQGAGGDAAVAEAAGAADCALNCPSPNVPSLSGLDMPALSSHHSCCAQCMAGVHVVLHLNLLSQLLASSRQESQLLTS